MEERAVPRSHASTMPKKYTLDFIPPDLSSFVTPHPPAHGAAAAPARERRGLACLAHAVRIPGDRLVRPRGVSLPVVLPAEPCTLVSAALRSGGWLLWAGCFLLYVGSFAVLLRAKFCVGTVTSQDFDVVVVAKGHGLDETHKIRGQHGRRQLPQYFVGNCFRSTISRTCRIVSTP